MISFFPRYKRVSSIEAKSGTGDAETDAYLQIGTGYDQSFCNISYMLLLLRRCALAAE